MLALAANFVTDIFRKTPKAKTSRPRVELDDGFANWQNARRRTGSINATYDAAGESDEFSAYWSNADAFDADSAHSPAVREKLVRRSRYEIANNGYSAGIASTYANDLVGIGPSLRMETASDGFNRMVEREWYAWTKEVHFRRKLWCQAHAKHSDGESFAVIRNNRSLRHLVKLDLVLHETEQCKTPYLPYGEPGRIDGIEFDEFGNVRFYDFVKQHPGSANLLFHLSEVERIPARYVMHWFKMQRPGQHRGVPETASTLNLGASARRWREATIAAAENIADFSLFIKTQFMPDEMDSVVPMSTMDVKKRMMTALPAGYEAFQPKAEQPTATYADFSKALVSEQARPKSMPANKAACDSSNYNYASGRLDHSTYYGSLDVERADANDLVLDPLFEVWFDYALSVFGWLGGVPERISAGAKAHSWDWPKHQVADIRSESSASDTRLKNSTTHLANEYSLAGLDYDDELQKQASSNGVTVDQQRQINMLVNLPQHVIGVVAPMLGIAPTTPHMPSPPQDTPDEQTEEDQEDE